MQCTGLIYIFHGTGSVLRERKKVSLVVLDILSTGPLRGTEYYHSGLSRDWLISRGTS